MHLERTVHFCTKVFSVFAIVCGKFFSLKYKSLGKKKKRPLWNRMDLCNSVLSVCVMSLCRNGEVFHKLWFYFTYTDYWSYLLSLCCFHFFYFFSCPIIFCLFVSYTLFNSTLLPLLLQCWPVSEGPSSMASRWKLETRCKSWRNVKVWCSFYTLPMWRLHSN